MASLCQYCFEFFCKDCIAQMHLPRLTRFCVPGHRLLKLDPALTTQSEDHLLFRGSSLATE